MTIRGAATAAFRHALKLLAVGSIAAAAPATAAISTFSSLAAYQAYTGLFTGPSTLFDFNSTPDASFANLNLDLGPFTLTGADASGPGLFEVVGGRVHAGVCNPPETCGGSRSYRIRFDEAIVAFGFDYSLIGGRPDGIEFTLQGVGSVGPVRIPGDSFFGFASSDPFTTIVVSGNFDFHYLDNFRFAQQLEIGGPTPGPVPEPATWAMMIAGFGLVGSALRRRGTRVATIA